MRDFFILLVLFPSSIMICLHVWASTPVVQFSWSTQECVKVVFGKGDCTNLPEKFTREWVK